MPNTFEPIVAVEDKAKATILDVLRQEPDSAEIGLVIAIAGIDGTAFKYSLAMVRLDDAADDDLLIRHEDLTLVIPAADVENLRGATIKMSTNLLEPGLVLDNPNTPSPRILGGDGDAAPQLTGSVAERAVQVVETMINPAIASHGGQAEIAGVEDDI